ncbi:MAG: tRNA 2-thiouridine(34) synthase MnmA [Bacteroidales bacterium]|nr:tRNA 2-thiouridine(34) synthase MnmA [Bacteroidales bacterium]
MNKVVVGLSGGVDSSVAAYLLKQQGYDVTGLFMINWHDTTGTLSGDCPWEDDKIFAELVARKLDIPFFTVDFSKEYREKVVDYMFSEYQRGRTPNPDVLCNREVKFDLFIKEARKLGADYVATGHYCRKDITQTGNQTIYRLLAGTDPSKEQSYFLCQLSQEQLKMALFPIGHMYKSEIRKIAEEQDLATAQKKDSQGICFVGKVDLPAFLQQKLKSKKGITIEIPVDCPIYKDKSLTKISGNPDLPDLKNVSAQYIYKSEYGKQVGEHNGAHFFTIGQNKGLNIGGRPKQSFVLDIDVVNNIVYTGLGQEHPGLYRKGLFIPKPDIHWIRKDLELLPGQSKTLNVRIRYRQSLQAATLFMHSDGLYIVFEIPQRGITPGQFAAWYENYELLGSGVIG